MTEVTLPNVQLLLDRPKGEGMIVSCYAGLRGAGDDGRVVSQCELVVAGRLTDHRATADGASEPEDQQDYV